MFSECQGNKTLKCCRQNSAVEMHCFRTKESFACQAEDWRSIADVVHVCGMSSHAE